MQGLQVQLELAVWFCARLPPLPFEFEAGGMKSALRSAPRGGPRNVRKDVLDQAALTEAINSHAAQHGALSMLDLGAYLRLPSSRAVIGSELARLHPVIVLVLAQLPSGRAKQVCLRSVYVRFIAQHPGSWKFLGTAKSLSDHAADLAGSWLTILSHCRRLTDPVRYRQATQQLSGEALERVQWLRDHFLAFAKDNPDDEHHSEPDASLRVEEEVDLDAVSELMPSQPDEAFSARSPTAGARIRGKQRPGPKGSANPGSKTLQAMKRPAAAPSKKAAQPGANRLKRPSGAQKLLVITQEAALAERPNGCSRCRGTQGCTPSCWRTRKCHLQK